MKKVLLLFIAVSISGALFANIKLAGIFGDDMVLQRNKPIAVWGWGAAGEKLTITFNAQVVQATVGKDGTWKTSIPAQKAGGPFTLKITGATNSILLNNILVGDVWICSGQSNMEWHVQDVNNAATEISTANYPRIRQITIRKTVAGQPLSDIDGSPVWIPATAKHVAEFTAVGYFFARDLYMNLEVPIGLIHTSWGGTDVETWTSRAAFQNDAAFKEMINKVPALNLDSLNRVQMDMVKQKLTALQNGIPDAGQVTLFKDPGFDDSKWPVLKVPGLWESQQLDTFDGVVWLRRTINISAESAGKAAVLHLATIDDNDETFINGISIGKTNGYNKEREYQVPAGLLKTGKNVIAVKIEDTGGGGGIYGEQKSINLQIGSENILLGGDWQFQVSAITPALAGIGPNSYPTLLYNGMIAPILPFTITGAIWYQGESNAGRAFEYRKSFPLMIKDWRKHWNQGEFPFYYVQLASFNANNGNSENGSTWAELREAQTQTLSLPNTGMAITTDIGTPGDIHPRNKQDVGKRLAAIALHATYHKKIISGGPVFDHYKIENSSIYVYFKPSESELKSADSNGNLTGFEIAGTDQKFKPAIARIEGNYVVVHHKDINAPVAVRYGWMDDASQINLFNTAGFPAGPFRTDSWPGITVKNKYRAE